ncbi:RNA-binding protein 28-like [Daphnia carinata]|uniref:RNA-binding protein 28-like n=1 Tax=Daphnia carinata TaxID=120202 RepID=UPI00257A0540|nr:RNA-binding protein 28-like [Daphnia carinata]
MDDPSNKKKSVDNKTNASKKKKPNKKGRIIIRNLSFKATEDAVRNWFLKYGEIEDVKLLRKPNGTLVGCGFVQYKTVPCAARAIKECNAKPFLGRPIAVDWAIPKQQYATQNKQTEDVQTPNEKPLAEGNETKENSDEEDSDEEEDKASDINAEEGSDSEVEKGSGDDENPNKEKKNIWKGDSAEVERKSDVGEGKTLFIRNLDFTTTKESLKNFFEEFGSVHYALLCVDKVMERPKGTGFVKFKDAESAQKCLDASRNPYLQLDGRVLDVVLAVTREDLENKKQEAEKKEHKDKRNLFLAREGFIRPGTLAAQGVSPTDMAKRQQNELWKKQMLRNLHMFISRERLCVHNLPPSLSDQQLAKLFKKHSSPDAKIVEARVMRDMKVIGEGNIHPSKGYGFVTFTIHEDALLALRNINNNPTLFSKDKRPIVEFSVENRAAVKAKQNRVQKSLENVKKGKNDKTIPSGASTVDLPVQEYSGAKADPKIKGLPSHRGPKIRHRKRPSAPDADSVPAKKPKIRRKMFKNPENRKASMKKKRPEGVGSKTKAVKKKIGTPRSGSTASKVTKANAAGKKGKWFDS